MPSQLAAARGTLASSQWNSDSSQDSDASNASTGRTTPPKPKECKSDTIKADLRLLATYLSKESAPRAVQNALGRISDAYKRRVENHNTELAVR